MVGGVGHPFKQSGPNLHEIGLRGGVEIPPDHERESQVVNNRGTAKDRCPAQCDSETTPDRIGALFTWRDENFWFEQAGDPQSKTLVWTLGTEADLTGLQPVHFAGALWDPSVRDVVR